MSQKQKYDKTEKEEKSYSKGKLYRKQPRTETLSTGARKKEIIQQTKNEEQNCEESEKDQRDVELTDERKTEYLVRAENIEKQLKDKL